MSVATLRQSVFMAGKRLDISSSSPLCGRGPGLATRRTACPPYELVYAECRMKGLTSIFSFRPLDIPSRIDDPIMGSMHAAACNSNLHTYLPGSEVERQSFGKVLRQGPSTKYFDKVFRQSPSTSSTRTHTTCATNTWCYIDLTRCRQGPCWSDGARRTAL